MGTTVLHAGVPLREGLHVYAHCLRGSPGGVALLAINNSRRQALRFSHFPKPGTRPADSRAAFCTCRSAADCAIPGQVLVHLVILILHDDQEVAFEIVKHADVLRRVHRENLGRFILPGRAGRAQSPSGPDRRPTPAMPVVGWDMVP
jgi:hypothetical protein